MRNDHPLVLNGRKNRQFSKFVDVIFPIQSLEYTKSLNFGSISKKNAKKNLQILIYYLKDNFYEIRNNYCV